jgi:hypothetical protein
LVGAQAAISSHGLMPEAPETYPESQDATRAAGVDSDAAGGDASVEDLLDLSNASRVRGSDSDAVPTPTPAPVARELSTPAGQLLFDRAYSFRFTYLAIFTFLMLYIFTIKGLESYLYNHFYRVADAAITITDFDQPVATKIQNQVRRYISGSKWVTLGGIEVSPMVMARDGTWIYVGGYTAVAPPERLVLTEIRADVERMLPATALLTVSVPHNSLIANLILVGYATLLIQVLWLRNRALARRESALLDAALEQRRQAVDRSRNIEHELEEIRHELHVLEPAEPEQASEVAALRNERQTLEGKLASLEAREAELRGSAAKAQKLGSEIRALEDLLDEASEDLSSKDEAIQGLEGRLKRATKDAVAEEASRVRESDTLARRFSTLYQNLEVDGRAIDDIVALKNETMKLKCEEKLKRLNDDAENVAVRRKVGGLPPHLTIFEIGFAGKGRIYYRKGTQRRFQVLNVGAKNSQNAALEYLRKL